MTARTVETTVGIVGGGPAGLMLSHLLDRAEIANVVVDNRTRDMIEHTHRAGILEQGSVRLLVDSGVSDRVLREGDQHEGIELRFRGESHRIHFQELVGASVWLYPQTDVFTDLADARSRDGGDVRFGVSDPRVLDPGTARPGLAFTDADASSCELRCVVLVGADGSRSMIRHELPERRQYAREYPFAWFGILCEAPHSSPELIYARSDRGFALISQRTESIQRMYFQCSPDEDPDGWSDEQIWEELQARLAGVDGFRLHEGRVLEKTVLPFRSFVCEPMRYGHVLLAGDAAHTVPPTGAKGLNLALADVRVLAEVLERFVRSGDPDVLDEYTPHALSRVWKAQHFSYWMTMMLHQAPGSSEFDDLRQLGELESLVRSEHGRRYLAECYTGWPFDGEVGR